MAIGERPETRYARSGDISLAYQVLGEGDLDLVFVMGWVSHLDLFWEEPRFARFLRRLASFSRLILFDKRGTGLSDRVPVASLPTIEQRMDDVRAVLDAVGSEHAALLGVSEGGPLCLLFAATYPERTRAVAVVGSYARRLRGPDHPWASSAEERDAFLERIHAEWGTPFDIDRRAPSAAGDPQFREWWATYLRMGASPGAAYALTQMNAAIDVRDALPLIQAPTLVVHRRGDPILPVEGSRYIADHVPGARLVELDGDDHLPFSGEQDEILDTVEEFLTGSPPVPTPDRVLASVLFTDVVRSTERAAAMGDARWRETLAEHNRRVRAAVERHGGRTVGFAGDGSLAAFDGPVKAIRAGLAAIDAVAPLGLELRAGVHTGEVERMGDDLGGLGVHIGARVAAAAAPGEVLVSRTVTDLVAGSGLSFEDRGLHELKGVPGEWRLFCVHP